MFLSGVKLIPELFSLHLTLWPAGGISGHDPPRSLLPLRGGRLLWSFIAVVLLDDSWFKSHSREDAEIWRVAVFKDSHGHSQHIKRVLSNGFRVAKWNKTNNISAQKQVGYFTLQSTVYSLQSTIHTWDSGRPYTGGVIPICTNWYKSPLSAPLMNHDSWIHDTTLTCLPVSSRPERLTRHCHSWTGFLEGCSTRTLSYVTIYCPNTMPLYPIL